MLVQQFEYRSSFPDDFVFVAGPARLQDSDG